MAYYDDSPSKNFSRTFFGVDYLNPYDNRSMNRIKWHLNKLDMVKYKPRFLHRRYMLFLEQLASVDMESDNPFEDLPKHNKYLRARFLKRHRLNLVKNIWSKKGSIFKRQIQKYHMPIPDYFYRQTVLNKRMDLISPLNPKKLNFTYDKPFPPVGILEKDKAFKLYDIE